MPGQSAKGNPASHRMSNPKRAARRERCWLRGQARKAERTKTNLAAASRNKRLRADGKLTPWEPAKRERHARRHMVQVQPAGAVW